MNRNGLTGSIIVLLVGLLLSACGGGAQPATSSASPQSTPAGPSPSPLTEFEENLQYVRNGQYTYIYIFSRKDGKPLEPADSNFLRTNAPQVVDWVLADRKLKTKIIGGTNFNLEEGNLAALKKRYNVEDYSGK